MRLFNELYLVFCTLQREESVRRNSESETGDAETGDHDPHYEPIVSLPLVDVPTNEEEEEELVKIRSRLYRYDTVDHEWKVLYYKNYIPT